MKEYYIIKNKKMPWGDYGITLFIGFLKNVGDDFEDLETPVIERAGPYVPDIYIANSRDLLIKEYLK